MGIYRLPTSGSLMAFRYLNKIVRLPLWASRLLLWRKSAIACAVLGLSCMEGFAATYSVYVYLSTEQLQTEFISNTTNQYKSKLTKSSTPNTYSIIISSKNAVATKSCDVPDDYAYGFADGMDHERWKNMELANNLRTSDEYKNTCAGFSLSPSTTTTFNSCQMTYRNVISSIGQRWAYVISSTGAIVQ